MHILVYCKVLRRCRNHIPNASESRMGEVTVSGAWSTSTGPHRTIVLAGTARPSCVWGMGHKRFELITPDLVNPAGLTRNLRGARLVSMARQ